MAEITVNTDILTSPAAIEYFSRADRRVMIGLRATLEMLGIPVPAYAVRKPPGRPPSKAISAAYSRDNPGGHAGGISRPVSAIPMGEDRDAYLAGRKLAKLQARIANRRNDNITG